MCDLEKAITALPGHSIALCRGDMLITSDLHGIAPMMAFLAEGKNLKGCSVADLVVGKAAATLFVKAGIARVFARTLSESGKAYLEEHGVPVQFEVLTPVIRNRTGDGICPMEQAVANLTDPEEAYAALCARLAALRAGK